MKRSIILWSLAVLLTLLSAAWQRLSGPTHPLRVTGRVGPVEVGGRLPRAGVSGEPLTVSIGAGPAVTGSLEWRRFPTDDPWLLVPLRRQDDRLTATITSQPPAGKVEYRLRLVAGAGEDGEPAHLTLPRRHAVVARFRGAVAAWALVPHILLMFLGMLWSTRAGLEGAIGGRGLARHSLAAFWLLLVGGLILGPVVQKQAFGAFWTGWPFGGDLTDNKTVVAVLAWLVAVLRIRAAAARGQVAGRGWAVGAAIVTLAIFAIPHSMLGSELDYDALPPPGP